MANFMFNPWIIALISGASLVAWLIPQMQAKQAGKALPDLNGGKLAAFETVGFGGILYLAIVLTAPLPAVKGQPFDVGGIILGITVATLAWWLAHLVWQKVLSGGDARWWGRGGMSGFPVASGLLLFKILLVDRVSHFDFGALLAGLLVVILLLMALGKIMGDRIKGKSGEDHPAVEFAKSLFSVVLVVLVLRQCIVEPFRIPSGSMMPTLLNGDFILVNKFAYGIRLPVTETKIIPVGKPERGDVVVFRYPHKPEVDFIKRIIGLPGDAIRYDKTELYVNGTKVQRALTQPYNGPQYRQFPPAILGTEILPNGGESKSHGILLNQRGNQQPRTTSWQVPEGHYFVMGDNRDNSEDGRFWRDGSFVPEGNLAGKAFFIWMNFDPEVGKPLSSRIFKKIQ